MQWLELSLTVDGPAQNLTVDPDDDLIVIVVPDGFNGGSIMVTCLYDGTEYPNAKEFSFSGDGPNGPFVFRLSEMGFTQHLLVRAKHGAATTPPASIKIHGRRGDK